MSTIPKWPGSGSAITGLTPFGLYDADFEFQDQGPKVAKWVAHRLGYPITDVELQDVQIYTCYEEAISEYSAQVHQFNIRQNMLKLQGSSTTTSATGRNIQGGELTSIIGISKEYGSEAGVGGDIEWKRAYIQTENGKQKYNLLTDVGSSLSGSEETIISGSSNVEIKRVFHNNGPASTRYYDPYSMSGFGAQNMINNFGWGGFSPAISFVMMPVYEDLLRIQAIEFNDMVRRSSYTFELIGNELTVFPRPEGEFKIFFDYIHKSDRDDIIFRSPNNVVSDYSNAPYENLTFSNINDPGKQWIKKYTLALCKELLGAIREKYSSIPIPGSEVSLDGAQLRAEAQTEKDALIEQLRENLEETSRRRQMEIEAEVGERVNSQLGYIPTKIYIG